MKDDEITWVLTKRKYSTFTWDFGKYKNKIAPSENCLPELNIQYGFRKFAGFCKIVGSISIDSLFKFYFASICTREEQRTVRPMGFTPEAEDEVIRETVPHKLDTPLLNPTNKVWRESTQTKTPTLPFQIGESIIYTN